MEGVLCVAGVILGTWQNPPCSATYALLLFPDEDVEAGEWRKFLMITTLETVLRPMSASLQSWTAWLFLLQKTLAYDINNQIRVIYIGG